MNSTIFFYKNFKISLIFFYHLQQIKKIAYTTHVDKPNITSTAKHHAPEGGTFVLTCEVKTAHDVKFKIEWIVPEGLNKEDKVKMIKINIQFLTKLLIMLKFSRAVTRKFHIPMNV